MQTMLKAFGVAVLFVAFAGSLAVAAPDGLRTEAPTIKKDDVFYGKADAPVTIIEYASLTCPHCGNFHKTVLQDLKKGPIAEGKVRVIYRDFPLDGLALRASALARCGGPDRRLAILDILYESQSSWARSSDPLGALEQIGKLAGIKEEQSRACMEDRAMLDRIIAEAQEGEQKHRVRSTPSFVIDRTLYRGGMSADDFNDVIDALVD